jgi:hypothetical protein
MKQPQNKNFLARFFISLSIEYPIDLSSPFRSHVYNKLENDIDSFLSLLVNYFRKSSVNKAKFREQQEELELVSTLVILALSKTRWLKLFRYLIDIGIV